MYEIKYDQHKMESLQRRDLLASYSSHSVDASLSGNVIPIDTFDLGIVKKGKQELETSALVPIDALSSWCSLRHVDRLSSKDAVSMI
jgi:hypothetical protein